MRYVFAAIVIMCPQFAFADGPVPKPEIAALGAMVSECQGREYQAKVQAAATASEIAALRKENDELKAKLSPAK